MYLKRLELKGFKSFPTKTDILFKEGITAIVGPNGSGKSNISDAVRWVLGEQSIKSLRGDKLEDVIFAGTDTKKAMNYCEVSLTIENTDDKLDIGFSEVTIKRRAYRNGESEFFLNNKGCRLKDIKEILLDTGIGKDGYSIIEQGKVDEILSNNPINRRKVFDEACGISKFRYKKQEAQKNLRNTKENLERINDIYVEIEKQLKPLLNQQSKAKKYLELNEKLKAIEVNSFINEIELLESELVEVEKHKKVLEEECKNTEKQKNEIGSKFNNLNEEIESMDDSINKSIDYINSIKSVINQKESQINLISERIKNSKNDIEREQHEISEIKEKLSSDTQLINELEIKRHKKEENIVKISKKVENIETKTKCKKQNIKDLNILIENLKDEIIDWLNKKQQSSNKLSTLNANKENINERTESIDSEISELSKSISNKNNEVSSLIYDVEVKQNIIDELKSKNSSTKNNLNTLLSKSEDLERNLQQSKYSLNDYKSKLNIYIDMENHHEGFNKGVKEVLKNKNLQGILGALGEIVTVKEYYEKAIEASLGAYMQNIITKDESSAKFAINYLKKNNLGRVTFLPINIIKSNKIDTSKIKTSTKFIGLASDLISYEEKYSHIVENILGRTIVIDNIDNAIKFAKETYHKFKIVTLDGEILNPGGSLTGGSIRNNNNILSRKRLISEFKEKINLLNDSIVEHEKKKVKYELKVEEIKDNIEEFTNNEKELDKVILLLNSDISRLKSEINNFQLNLNKLEKEKQGLGSNLDYTLNKARVIEDEIKDIDIRHSDTKDKIEQYSTQLKDNNELYEKEKYELDELNLELVKNKQIHDSLLKDLQRINDDKVNLINKSKHIEQELKNQELGTSKLEEEITIENIERLNLNEQLESNNKSLENKKALKNDLKSKLEDLNREVKNSDRKYIDLKESLFKVENKVERVKSNQETYINKLFENYELTVVQAIEIKDTNMNIDKKLLESLKRDIRSLGNINVDSIKEYEEVKERYDFYDEQKQDLEESVKAIESIVSDLEENMKSEFEIKFNEINNNFKYVYKRLFGGGYGEITILDKENILDSDIEITAQPPGKKMKNLNLLSGGEKALTAISILFAILLAKPTPFCILDEIEAPLDDANIFRFGEFLKELSKDTQFISVTHRRGTMEAANYIYGVTMQEKAISKVLSLKLNEAKEITDVI